jgi:deoxycytidylate deaminase
MDTTAFDWNKLAFGSKKPLKDLKAIFIAAPREMSGQRFKQIVKTYLPKGNIVLGLSKETYVNGFEDQPQFRMLQRSDVQKTLDLVRKAAGKYGIYTLSYSQRDLLHILDKIPFARVVLVNGSWKYAFHTQPPYYKLAEQGTPHEFISPFTDEAEARKYEADIWPEMQKMAHIPPGPYKEQDMLAIAGQAATLSFDYSFQTGVALGRKSGSTYKLLEATYNKVVPYQTYALLHGNTRERHMSPPNDLNHYDTVHAEVELILKAGREKIPLEGTTLFINLLPCPSCARMFAESDIDEFVYSIDHSDGYAVKMLEAAGKKVRRIVT